MLWLEREPDAMTADTSRDIDGGRMEVQNALASSEARLRALLEAAVDGIISIAMVQEWRILAGAR